MGLLKESMVEEESKKVTGNTHKIVQRAAIEGYRWRAILYTYNKMYVDVASIAISSSFSICRMVCVLVVMPRENRANSK